MALVRPYIEAFPSLRVLRFDYTYFRWQTAFMPTHSLLTDTLRGKSSAELRKHNRQGQFARGSWPGLEYFMAMTLDAYMAGLTCQISNLHLLAWGGTMDAEISAICAIFADARPSRFRLAMRPAHVDYLAALFYERAELFSSLSTLELRLDLAVVSFDFKSYIFLRYISSKRTISGPRSNVSL
ncbi:hypothetical protein LXA43DRAFT_1187497 [Ganoderma leucocontextum]|nr:hypothetical protein LXA43DRAFT_1187497 [Ganoderma leucocontextum]